MSFVADRETRYMTELGGTVGPLWDVLGYPRIVSNTIGDWDRETGKPMNGPARETWGRLIPGAIGYPPNPSDHAR